MDFFFPPKKAWKFTQISKTQLCISLVPLRVSTGLFHSRSNIPLWKKHPKVRKISMASPDASKAFTTAVATSPEVLAKFWALEWKENNLF